MGVMIDGTYHAEDPGWAYGPDGSFQRAKSVLRGWITSDGDTGFAPEPGRYHLYAAWNCPWAHRVLLMRLFKGLEDQITVSYAAPRRTEDGWVFPGEDGYSDPLKNVSALHQVYAEITPAYTGRITVPLLWDRSTNGPVSNESADLVRMLNDAFPGPDLAPQALRAEIDTWNTRIHAGVNNGVYRAGFARTQEAYDSAVTALFDMLDDLDTHLAGDRYLLGDTFTEADLRLFPTLARFDVAYHYAFKCNIRKLSDYAHLWPYAREIYQMPGVAETVKLDIYKRGYFSPSELRNPLGIVPAGPLVDWDLPHGRDAG